MNPSSCVSPWPPNRTARIAPPYLVLLALLLPRGVALSGDWPAYLHDSRRSGVTEESLCLPLAAAWTHRSPHAPRPAWPPPAKQDFWHHHRGLQPEVTYDRAYHIAVAGDTVLYGSSADDKVYCLEASTGSVRWTFFAEGPVRLAPTISGDRALFGSDDGSVYALSTTDGSLLWKRRLAPEDRRIPGNGRMISAWPVRTGVVVEDGVALAGAGLFPTEGAYVYALAAADGEIIWRRERADISPQGYCLASPTHLFVPSGRAAPVRFRREDGEHEGELKVDGGAFALLSDDVLVSGPGRTTGVVAVADVETRERIATFPGLRLIVHDGKAYLHAEDSLAALDRVRYLELARERVRVDKRREELEMRLEAAKKGRRAEEAAALAAEVAARKAEIESLERAMAACFLWRRPFRYPYSLILGGDTLYAGGDAEVVAVAASTGEDRWSDRVDGRAHGLAIAGGRLYASTDRGAIHCFLSGEGTP